MLCISICYWAWFANILFWVSHGCQWMRPVCNFPPCTDLTWLCSGFTVTTELIEGWPPSLNEFTGQRQCSCASPWPLGLRDHWWTPLVTVRHAGFSFLLKAALVADVFLGICPFHLFSNWVAKKQPKKVIIFSYICRVWICDLLFSACVLLSSAALSPEQDAFQTEADLQSLYITSPFSSAAVRAHFHILVFFFLSLLAFFRGFSLSIISPS